MPLKIDIIITQDSYFIIILPHLIGVDLMKLFLLDMDSETLLRYYHCEIVRELTVNNLTLANPFTRIVFRYVAINHNGITKLSRAGQKLFGLLSVSV